MITFSFTIARPVSYTHLVVCNDVASFIGEILLFDAIDAIL